MPDPAENTSFSGGEPLYDGASITDEEKSYALPEWVTEGIKYLEERLPPESDPRQMAYLISMKLWIWDLGCALTNLLEEAVAADRPQLDRSRAMKRARFLLSMSKKDTGLGLFHIQQVSFPDNPSKDEDDA